MQCFFRETSLYVLGIEEAKILTNICFCNYLIVILNFGVELSPPIVLCFQSRVFLREKINFFLQMLFHV